MRSLLQPYNEATTTWSTFMSSPDEIIPNLTRVVESLPHSSATLAYARIQSQRDSG
ncbi:hypothetical protein BGZ65_005636, partial [Modicella reniformis]